MFDLALENNEPFETFFKEQIEAAKRHIGFPKSLRSYEQRIQGFYLESKKALDCKQT